MLKKIANNIYLTLIFLLISQALNPLASMFINSYFPYRLPAHDLIFSITPTILWLQYVSDPILIIGQTVFILTIIKFIKSRHRKKIFGQIIFASALALFLRAITMILTPMQRMETFNQPYGIFQVIQHGLFPSGHTAASFLLYLFAKHLKFNKPLTIFFCLQTIIQIIVLLLSRGHYSVDIAGGIMIAYISFRITQDLT